jgi:hypothetical protein
MLSHRGRYDENSGSEQHIDRGAEPIQRSDVVAVPKLDAVPTLPTDATHSIPTGRPSPTHP